MSKLTLAVQQFLDLMNWEDEIRVDEDRRTSSMATCVTVDAQPCDLFVETDDGVDVIAVFLYAPFRVRPEKLVEACVLANEINVRSRIGHVEIVPEDGRIRYVHTVDFEDCEPTGTAVRNMVQAGFSLFRRRLGQLAEVAMTPRTAAEVLAAAEDASQAGAGQGAGQAVAVDDVPEAL